MHSFLDVEKVDIVCASKPILQIEPNLMHTVPTDYVGFDFLCDWIEEPDYYKVIAALLLLELYHYIF